MFGLQFQELETRSPRIVPRNIQASGLEDFGLVAGVWEFAFKDWVCFGVFYIQVTWCL